MARHTLSRGFYDRVQAQQELGITCEGQPASFVPYAVLRSYWTVEKIEQLSKHANIYTTPRIIRDGYLIVFSILVFTSHTVEGSLDFFDSFVSHSGDDQTLTRPVAPNWLKTNPQGQRIFEVFHEEKWKFCPVLFDSRRPLSDTLLDRRCIFPFADKQRLDNSRRDREASVSSVCTHALAHKHLPISNLVPQRVVLKSYPQAFQDLYEKERIAFAALNPRSRNIVLCHGSYHWLSENKERTSVLILEYAEGGTLQDLFERGKCPFEPSDVLAMWKGLLDMVKGLETIHEQIGAIHQDLKPSNILVFPPGYGQGEFEFVFKISDFGACHFPTRDHSPNGRDAIYHQATRTYSAPEVHFGDIIRYTVKGGIDMWSVGCILVEAAVWITLGEQGRQKFRDMRMRETSKLMEHHSRGKSDCFHDGKAVLKSVKEVEDLVRQYKRATDDISLEVVQLAQKWLLADATFRLQAQQLHGYLIKTISDSQMITQINGNLKAQDPGPSNSRSTLPIHEKLKRMTISETKGTASLGHHQPTPSPDEARKEYPYVSIDDLKQWINGSKADSELPGWIEAKEEIQDRDFTLIIDNSASMQRRKSEVLAHVKCISYLIKKLDKDGLQVMMTSKPHGKQPCTTSTQVAAFIEKHFSPGTPQCNMELALEKALDDVYEALPKLSAVASKRKSRISRLLTRRPKPFTILVFTDGVWDEAEDGVSGADHPIEDCIRLMKEHGVHRTNVAIQFVRFGEEEKGIRRLEFLDDDLMQRPDNAKYDIVDHKPQNASIWDILLGAMSAVIDKKKGKAPSQRGSSSDGTQPSR